MLQCKICRPTKDRTGLEQTITYKVMDAVQMIEVFKTALRFSVKVQPPSTV